MQSSPLAPSSAESPLTSSSPSRRKRVNPIRVGVVVLIGTILFFAGALARHNFDPLVFVRIGPLFNEGIPNANNGYDGQFAYYIATEGPNATPKLDLPPAFRYQRIVYPVLSAILGLGQRALIPWAMLAINILAHAAAAGLLAHLLATRTRVSSWWAVVPALWVGALVSVRLDLNEPLAMALSLAAVALYFQNRFLVAGLVFGLAGLTKDLGLILAGGLILFEFSQRHFRRGIILGVLSAGPYAIWAILLRLWLGVWPSQPSAPRLPLLVPFINLSYAPDVTSLLFEILWAMLPALLIGGAVLYQLRRDRTRPEIWMALGAAIFTLYIPPANIAELIGTLRIIQPLIVASILFIALTSRKRLIWLGVLWAPSILLAILIAYF